MKKTFLVLLLTCFLGGTSIPQASEPTLTLQEIKSSTFDPPVVDEPVWQFFVNMSARNPPYYDVGSALRDLPEKLGDLCAIFRFDVEASLTGISEAAMAHDDWEPSEAVMKRTIVAYRRWGGEAQAKLIEELMPVVKKHFELAELEETEENEEKLDAIEGEYEKFQERWDNIEDQTAWEKITADVKKSPEDYVYPAKKPE